MAFSGLAKSILFCLSIVNSQGKSLIVPSVSQTASRQSIHGDQSNDTKPIISRFHINSNIEFRYAHTTVESYVKNPSLNSQEVTFTAIIPNSAFISNFSMVFDGEEYVATVAAKEEAKRLYEEAVTSGRGAGLVSQDVRDSKKFTVSANVEPQVKVIFKMTYEELLERKLGWYEHVINVNPGQVVNDLKIRVNIDESLPLDKLSVPELKQSNEIDFEPGQENEIAQVDWEKGNATAVIEFAPTKEQQEEYGEQGLAGQLLVKYDVERDNKANEIQVIDGYFVHFFTPENLKTLPKHVIFVLDISGSMSGDKIMQLKNAMSTILDDMTEQDYFNIITFSSSFNHLELPSKFIAKDHQFNLIEATDENRGEAIKYINSINANGGTNINDGLLEGLKLAAEAKKNEALPTNLQSIVIFLSGGEATSGETNGNAIKNNVKNANLQLKVPIYSLGFGKGADFNLIKDISIDAGALAKHIYEDSDAALQLADFFAEIASPLLSDLKFNYVGGLVDNSSMSQNHLATFYKGGEFIVTGKLQQTPPQENDFLEVTVSASGENGSQYDHKASICLTPCALPGVDNMTGVNDILYNPPLNPLLRTCPMTCLPPPPPPACSQAQNILKNLHAFLNIKQLLKKTDKIVNGTNPSKEKALRLSLDNNFVTELTSLVVTSPNQTAKISSLQYANEPHDANTYQSSVGSRAIQSSGGSSAIQIANTYQSSGGSSGFQSAFIGSSGRSGNQCAKDEDCLTFFPNLDNKTEIVECKTIPATASMPIQFECKKKKKVVSNKESSLTEILESRKMDYKNQNTDVTKLEIDGTPPPWPRPGVLRIILISDTHNKHRNLKMPPGDILIHSGDFTNRGSIKAIQEFDAWLGELPYQHKVVVPGNHDTAMDPAMWDDNPHIHDIDEPAHISKTDLIKNANVLINESVEMRGISIFGAPYTLDPFKLDWWAYKADTENDMEALINMPTHSVDIVVTHSPPYGIGDLTVNGTPAGSKAVLNKVTASNPALHVFGHIHEAAGAYVYAKATSQKNVKTNFINASSIPWTLKPIGPIVVDISEETKDVLNISRGPE